MSDQYHFHRDPSTLREALLTKDEANAIDGYRSAMEAAQAHGFSSVAAMVIVLPVPKDLASEKFMADAQTVAQRAVLDLLRSRMAT